MICQTNFCSLRWIIKHTQLAITLKNLTNDNVENCENFICVLRVSAINYQLYCKSLVLQNARTRSWNSTTMSLGPKKKIYYLFHQVLASSTWLQSRSFNDVKCTRTAVKCTKVKSARAKRVKLLFVIVKYVNFWPSWFLPRCARVNSIS